MSATFFNSGTADNKSSAEREPGLYPAVLPFSPTPAIVPPVASTTTFPLPLVDSFEDEEVVDVVVFLEALTDALVVFSHFYHRNHNLKEKGPR